MSCKQARQKARTQPHVKREEREGEEEMGEGGRGFEVLLVRIASVKRTKIRVDCTTPKRGQIFKPNLCPTRCSALVYSSPSQGKKVLFLFW